MTNFHDVEKENMKVHNSNYSRIPDHPYRISIIGGSVTRKTNSLFNQICRHQDIDKIYLYAKDPCEAKYQLLTNKQESKSLRLLNDCKAFIKYSNGMDDIYKNIEEYSSNKKAKY